MKITVMNIVRNLHVMLMTIVLSSVTLQTVVGIAADPNPEKEARIAKLRAEIKSMTLEEQAKVKRAIEQERYDRMLQEQVSRLPSELSAEVGSFIGGVEQFGALENILIAPFIRRFDISSNTTNTLGYSPNGMYIAVYTAHGSKIRVLNAADGEEISFIYSEREMYGCTFSPDSRNIAAGHERGLIVVWDVIESKELYRLHTEQYVGRAGSFSYSPNGQYLAAGYDSGAIIIWDVINKKEFTVNNDIRYKVFSLRYSLNGQYIAAGYSNGQIIVWDAEARNEIHRLNSHDGAVGTLWYSPNGNFIAARYKDLIIIWDVTAGKELHRLHAGKTPYSCSYSPDGKDLAVGYEDGSMLVWDAVAGKVIHTLDGGAGSVFSCSYSPDGKHLATGCRNALLLWSIEKLNEISNILNHLTIEEHPIVTKINAALVNRGALITPENPQGLVALTAEDYKVLAQHTKLRDLLMPVIVSPQHFLNNNPDFIQAMKIVDNLDTYEAYKAVYGTLKSEKVEEYKRILNGYKGSLEKALTMEKEISNNPGVIAKITAALKKIEDRTRALTHELKVRAIQSKKQHGGKLPPF